jgi:hypothetical protein
MATTGGSITAKIFSRDKLQREAFFAKWSKADWTKRDGDLAVEEGVSREWVRQIRHLIGAPLSPYHGRTVKTIQALQWAKENLNKLKGVCPTELLRDYGLRVYWKGSPVYHLLKPFLRDGRLQKKHRWDLMDFRLSN